MFDSPPTLQEWRTVLDWPIEKTEKAKTRLVESTFVTERSDPKTGNKIYIALPITLSFAKLEFDKMGKWGLEARSRYDSYNQKITLSQEQEYQSEDLFKRFDARTNNQKRAILFARMAEGQMSSMGSSEAEEYYHQALEFDPLSIYTLVSYGKFKAELFDYSSAIGLIQKAVSLVTKKTGFYVYYNLADVYGKTKDLELKIRYLHEAMKYKDNTSPYLFTMAQHSLGVALGKLNRHEEAIKNFDEIIEREMAKSYGPSASLVVAAKTKKISLDRTLPGASEIFLKELINRCKSRSINGSILEELSELLVE
jgi:tetratricopeptide (TPR) repeat protein